MKIILTSPDYSYCQRTYWNAATFASFVFFGTFCQKKQDKKTKDLKIPGSGEWPLFQYLKYKWSSKKAISLSARRFFFPRMHLVVHIVHQLASDIAKVSEAIALTQPASHPPPVHMFVCALNCVCASLGRRPGPTGPAPRVCVSKPARPKWSLGSLQLSYYLRLVRAGEQRCWETERMSQRGGGINVGYKNISHPQPLALTCHIFFTPSTSFSYSQQLKEGIYLHYFKHGKSQNFLLHFKWKIILLKKSRYFSRDRRCRVSTLIKNAV